MPGKIGAIGADRSHGITPKNTEIGENCLGGMTQFFQRLPGAG